MNLSTSVGFVFDLETTGLEADSDRVVALAGVRYSGGVRVSGHRVLLDPERPIPPESTEIHGITDAQVRGRKKFRDVAQAFSGRVSAADWLCSYAAADLDVPMVLAEMRRAGRRFELRARDVLDPLVTVRWYLRHLRSRRLEHVCIELGIPHVPHSALSDAQATGELLLRTRDLGWVPDSVGEALDAQEATRLLLDEEWRTWSYWIYSDRASGELRTGCGKYVGRPLDGLPSGYVRSLLKIPDLPPAVRKEFSWRAG